MTCYGCRCCYSAEVLLCETIEQPYYVMKSNMAAPGKFRNENRRSSNHALSDTELLFPCFPTKFQSRLYFQKFNVNMFPEWRFPLRIVPAIAPAHAFCASRDCPRKADFCWTEPTISKLFLRGLWLCGRFEQVLLKSKE